MTPVDCWDFDDFLHALADEKRQRLLQLLQAGAMNVSSEHDICH